jgi:hypothetical protein
MGNWTREKLELMYRMREEGKTFSEISEKIKNKSPDACSRKYSRINWADFNNKLVSDNSKSNKVWSQQEMLQLYTYLDAEQSYSFIAGKLGRSTSAVESKAQQTNWEAWHETAFFPEEDGTSEKDEDHLEKLVTSLVYIGRNKHERIKAIKKEEFLRKINLEEKDLSFSYTELKRLALEELDNNGLGNPETISFGEGTYIVVGDSHGKHTRRKMFSLLKNINDFFDAEKIIHIGHLLDDDNEISFKWGDFDNLLVLSKDEELKVIHKKRNSHNFSYEIAREGVQLGEDLSIMSQEKISDYSVSALRLLDNELYEGKMITNLHRMETVSKASAVNSSHYLCSPGALCEKHIVRTIKQIDFQDGKTQKVAYSESFQKYRKMKKDYKYWNQGVIIVHVDKHGDHTLIPCPIKEIDGEYYTSYFNKIVSSKGILNPTKKIFVHGDMHAPSHDSNILDMQEQICKDYNPDVFVNIGDAFDASSISHHDMDRGNVINGCFLDEAAKTNHILKKMSSWAPELHIIVGNHERFIQDFVKKFPQFSNILNFEFVCGVKELGYKVTKLKNVLEIGSTKFIHGDMLFYNQTGNKLEKVSRTLGHNTFIGHIHYPSIRFGCLSVGFSGLMDQGYNESQASSWIHGFGLCNQYKGESFPTTIAIFDKKLILNGEVYTPQNPDAWNIEGIKPRIEYEVEESNN